MELKDKMVVILSADDYEDVELFYIYYRMQEAGAKVQILGIEMSYSTLRGKRGYTIPVDMHPTETDLDKLDALIIPGGWAPERIAWCDLTMDLVKRAFDRGKLIAAISRGGWVLACANIVSGKNVTSDPSVRNNLRNAGGNWLDEELVVDGNLITAKSSSDLPSFCKEIIKALS